MAAVLDYLDKHEIDICRRVNRFGATGSVQRFFSAVSRLGDWPYWVMMGAVLVAMQGLDSAPQILRMGATCVLAVLIYKSLKNRLVRERPFMHHRGIACGTAPLDRYSFPSGHTMHAISFSLMFGSVDPLFYWLCVPFAALVMLSRVVLGLHYPSDVLVGGLLGATLAMASNALV